MVYQPFDTSIDFLLVRHSGLARIRSEYWALRQFVDRLFNDLDAFKHLHHSHLKSSIAIATLTCTHIKIEIIVSKIRLVATKIASDATGSGNRSGRSTRNRFFAREYSYIAGAFNEDSILHDQTAEVAIDLWEVSDKIANHFDPVVSHVVEQPTDSSVRRVKSLPRCPLANLVNRFALVERIHECSRAT